MQNTLEEDLNSVLGNCLGLTEPCQCNTPRSCEWCGNAGWLTPKVKQLKIAAQKEELARSSVSDLFMNTSI
ncbi:hypothetical protein [Vibrio gangliei]|uniref:hypothetical protein n=1 Tax=Vibrio gangliei TaxID=2077090 RepID=UPI000D01890B|nr:hypothetical protein [Vibrio gangliei]